jgi:hypothetical protein
VRKLEDADRGGEKRRRYTAPEELDARVAVGHVTQHARDDLPVLEGFAARGDRRLHSGAPGDIREGLR